jgi:hypothetical protein
MARPKRVELRTTDDRRPTTGDRRPATDDRRPTTTNEALSSRPEPAR